MSLDTFRNRIPRDQVITGLRQLADYLQDHGDIPVPPYGWELLVCTHENTDPDGIASVDQIAAALGVTVTDRTADDGHYHADKAFGAVTYRAFHIPVHLREERCPATVPDPAPSAAAR